jgi:hypothetical protein
MIVIANAVVGFDSYRDPGHVTFLNPEFGGTCRIKNQQTPKLA